MRKILIGFLCSFPLLCQAQSLEQVIRLAQDSTIAAFQSRYEYEYHQQHFARFEALRKPQLELRLTPNYYKLVTDPTRDYVYIRNYNRFSTSAQLMLSQKVLGLGGDAFVSSSALWSEYFMHDQRDMPREFVTMPVVVGYQQSLVGYNPYRWERLVENARLEAARKQLNYQLHQIAEEATRRFFRLACAQGMLDMCERNKQTADTLYAIAREKAGIAMVSLAELRSLELQRLNAANALHSARNEEQLARESLSSYLRTGNIPAGSRLTVPTLAGRQGGGRFERGHAAAQLQPVRHVAGSPVLYDWSRYLEHPADGPRRRPEGTGGRNGPQRSANAGPPGGGTLPGGGCPHHPGQPALASATSFAYRGGGFPGRRRL